MNGMVAHLWQSTLFAVAAGFLSLAFRENRAKVRFCLWLSASVKFLIPFSPLLAVGSHFTWAPVVTTPEVSYVVEQIAEPFSGSYVHPAATGVNWTNIAIGGLWAVGFVTIVLMRVRSWLRIRAALDASTPIDIPCEVAIRSSAGLLEPCVAGWSSPVLLLPEGIREQLTELQLAAVLAHEICHVRRRDNLWAAVHMLVEALFWFHPLVWWIGGRLVEDRERACDEGVLKLGSEPQVYADAIVGVCKLYVESPMVCVSGVTGANLKKRIDAIMMNRTGTGLGFAKKFLLVGSGIAAFIRPGGNWSVDTCRQRSCDSCAADCGGGSDDGPDRAGTVATSTANQAGDGSERWDAEAGADAFRFRHDDHRAASWCKAERDQFRSKQDGAYGCGGGPGGERR
jgi:bla regulator protein blaR1